MQGIAGNGSIVMLGFPFETITSAATRAAIMDRVLNFFGVTNAVPTADFDGDGDVDGRDFLAWQRGFGASSPTLSDGDANGDAMVDGNDLEIWQSQYGLPQPLSALSAALMSDQAVELDGSQLAGIAGLLGIKSISTELSKNEEVRPEVLMESKFTSGRYSVDARRPTSELLRESLRG